MRHLQLFMVLELPKALSSFRPKGLVQVKTKLNRQKSVTTVIMVFVKQHVCPILWELQNGWIIVSPATQQQRDLTLTEQLIILLQMLIFSLCSKMEQNGKNLLYTAHGKIIKVMIGRVKYCVPHRNRTISSVQQVLLKKRLTVQEWDIKVKKMFSKRMIIIVLISRGLLIVNYQKQQKQVCLLIWYTIYRMIGLQIVLMHTLLIIMPFGLRRSFHHGMKMVTSQPFLQKWVKCL